MIHPAEVALVNCTLSELNPEKGNSCRSDRSRTVSPTTTTALPDMMSLSALLNDTSADKRLYASPSKRRIETDVMKM